MWLVHGVGDTEPIGCRRCGRLLPVGAGIGSQAIEPPAFQWRHQYAEQWRHHDQGQQRRQRKTAYQHRAEASVQLRAGAREQHLGARTDAVLDAVEQLLLHRRRALSAIEGFNAALRPFFYVHKGVNQGFPELFRAHFNLRTRRWGRHKGHQHPSVSER